MTAKKEKLLESAQKFIAKGQLDRAIRDYEQIVSLEPDEIRHRQKFAELLVRVNQKEAAIAEYETISRQYSSKHFYLKAIAVHKQIQKLDPDNIKITLALASLNEKQGLLGNALAEYNLAVTHYLKEGSLSEAIRVIELMLAADPDNLNTRLKCAETYFTAGEHDKAYEEFARLGLLLRKRGDESAFGRVCERVRSLYPDKKDFPDESPATVGGESDALIAAVSFEDNGEELPAPDAASTPLPETTPPLPVDSLPVEPTAPPGEMSWEEEIDLSLLEEEGITCFQDEGAIRPDELNPTQDLAGQGGTGLSDAEAGDTAGIDDAATALEPESLPEEASGPAGFTESEEMLSGPAGITEIDLELEGPIDLDGWLQEEPPQTGPIAAEDIDSPLPPDKKRKRYDLDGQFSEFKEVVDKQLDKDDTETHYDLGIAYKEMCLFGDAINEFQTASINPQRQIDCLTLQGICYRDKGDYDKAEEVFQSTLSRKGLTIEETVSLSYELASLYETTGREEDALRLYRQVRVENPGYRDVAKKIELLHGGENSPEIDEMELLELDAEEVE